MLLRNKKTGEVKKMWKDNICLSFGDCNNVYYSLAELNADWEDYKPAEPLIKDEKVRKAVRAWAEANNIRAVYYSPEEDGYGEHYTINELCGEEEE